MSIRTSNIAVVLMLTLLLSGCDLFRKKTNWNISLNRTEKKPYGGFLAYESLKFFFPGAELHPLSQGFRYSSIDDEMIKGGRSLFIAVGLDFYLSEPELRRLVAFAESGNEVIVFARTIDGKLEDKLGCTIKATGFEEMPLTKESDGRLNLHTISLATDQHKDYGYQGRNILGFFDIKPAPDSSNGTAALHPDTLGYVKSSPDLVRYAVGKGHISLHAAPLVMSNYFLLQADNYKYLEGIWQTLPAGIRRIYWSDYFKRSPRASDLGVLLKYPGTRWAFILALFGLLVYVLFEAKRKQRIVPVVTPLENSSASFVETVGRLYFNKGDHSNLGEKMVQHFLEWVRTHYFLNTSQLDEHFKQQLILRSGMAEPVVRSLMELIQAVHIERKQIDEQDLYHLHRTIQQFYKNHG